jgi:uronate dehydrogenase
MRIGNVNNAPIDRRRLAIWISPRDMAQLVTIGIEQPDLHFEVVYGVSDNARSWYDNSNALRLGYHPQDRSERYAGKILDRDGPPGNRLEDIYQGGGHCFSEGGTQSRLAPAPSPKRARAKKAARTKK